MSVLGGSDLGFDEGGVLQALSRPFRSKVTETYSYRTPRGHKEAVLVAKTTVTSEYSMADVMIILVTLGLVTYGPGILGSAGGSLNSLFSKGLGPGNLIFGASGLAIPAIMEKVVPVLTDVVSETPNIFDVVVAAANPINMFGNAEATGKAIDVTVGMLRRVMDPFGFFD